VLLPFPISPQTNLGEKVRKTPEWGRLSINKLLRTTKEPRIYNQHQDAARKENLVDTHQAAYATSGSSSPGAMKFVFGLPVSFAAEHLAIVGELLEITSVK